MTAASQPKRQSRIGQFRRAFSVELPKTALLALVTCAAAALEVISLGILVALAALVTQGLSVYSKHIEVVDITISLTLRELCLCALAAVALRLVLQVFSVWLNARIQVGYKGRMMRGVVDAFVDAPWSLKSELRASEFQTIVTTHVMGCQKALSALSKFIIAGANVAILLSSALAISFGVVLIAFVMAGILFLALKPLSRWARKKDSALAKLNVAYGREVVEMAQLARELEAFNVIKVARRRLHDTIGDFENQNRATTLATGILPPIYQNSVIVLGVFVLAAVSRLHGVALDTVGVVVVLMLRLSTYTQTLQAAYHAMFTQSVYLDELESALARLSTTSKTTGNKTMSNFESFEARGLCFDYGDERVLDDVNFRIEKGETIGVAGPSGSGKSTLVQLLLRLYAPVKGVLNVNGIGVGEVAPEDWARCVAYVPQEPVLIDDTIAGNIRFFREGISHAEIEEASRLSAVHDAILAQPQGYDTPVGERGGSLSVGQRQRICIARALVGRPQVLILDEPTSALDPESEQEILETLSELRSRVTMVMVAHRMNTLDICSRILWFEKGRFISENAPAKDRIEIADDGPPTRMNLRAG